MEFNKKIGQLSPTKKRTSTGLADMQEEHEKEAYSQEQLLDLFAVAEGNNLG